MSDEMTTTFTLERIAEQAGGNATALALATISYLRDHDLDVDEYFVYVGRRLAPTWEERQGQAPRDVAEAVALNAVSFGATVQSLSGDDSQAKLVVQDWPPEEMQALFPLDVADIDPIWDIYQPIAEYLGLHYDWKRQGNEVIVTFSRWEND